MASLKPPICHSKRMARIGQSLRGFGPGLIEAALDLKKGSRTVLSLESLRGFGPGLI